LNEPVTFTSEVAIMNKPRRTLSIADQKAVDVFLDHAVDADRSGITRMVEPVAQRRLNAASSLLSLLSEMPVIDPPVGLAARTMQRIEQHDSEQVGHRTPIDQNKSAHVH
jgi:hypothetical protein